MYNSTLDRLQRSLIILGLLVGMVFVPTGSAFAGQTKEWTDAGQPEEMEAFLDQFLAEQMSQLEVPGLAITVVVDGEVFLAKGYGYADLEQNIPFDPDRTIVRGGSIIKTITALAVMQLADQGLIDLDANVNGYLTTFKIPDTFDKAVTARQLLHYTGGFDSKFVGIRVEEESQLPALRDYLAENLPPRTRPPGNIRAYNDHEIALAGLLVEEVSGMPYDAYVQKHIFEPLGMTSSSLILPHDQLGRTALGYSSTGPYPLSFYYLKEAPGSGFNTTPSDMARYMIAHLQGNVLDGERIISEEAMRELHTTRFQHEPHLPGIAYTFDEVFRGDTRILAKSGGAPGFQNRMLLFPEQKMGIYFVYNRDYKVPMRQRLEQALLNRYFPIGEDTRTEIQPAAVAIQPERYSGYYVSLNDYSEHSIEKVQQLLDQVQVKVTEEGNLELFGGTLLPMGSNLFQWNDSGDFVAFAENENGQISHLFENRSAYLRLPWYETFPVQIALLGFSLAIFVVSLTVLLVALLRRQPRMYVLPGAISFLNLGFLVGLGIVFMPVFAGEDPPWIFSFAPTPALLFLLAIPLVTAALTAILMVQTLQMWRQGQSTVFHKVHSMFVVFAGLAFLFFLHTWNLLGYRL